MKHLFSYAIVWCAFMFGVQNAISETWYTVRWVDDGDSIVLQDGRHVRYIGINAPEIQHGDRHAELFGDQAKSLNKEWVFQKKVRLEYGREKKDRYGRTLAYLYLPDGLFLNAEMIVQGAAFHLYLRPNTRFTSLLIEKQREAMLAGRGLWQDWRESKAEYIGNKRSRRFHLPTCPFAKKIKSTNKVIFPKKWNGFWAGYAPAKRCVTHWWGE
jgi:micrococcal nuclease